jgi:hypothetical protein
VGAGSTDPTQQITFGGFLQLEFGDDGKRVFGVTTFRFVADELQERGCANDIPYPDDGYPMEVDHPSINYHVEALQFLRSE